MSVAKSILEARASDRKQMFVYLDGFPDPVSVEVSYEKVSTGPDDYAVVAAVSTKDVVKVLISKGEYIQLTTDVKEQILKQLEDMGE